MAQEERPVVGPDGHVTYFPVDATDAEVSAYLKAIPVANAPHAPKARTWSDFGKDLAIGALNTLPAIGAVAGGAVATMPGVTLPAAAFGAGLGAGLGRGARDLIAEGVGLEKPTGVVQKGARIAGDIALTAMTPGVVEAAKTPLRTLSEAAVTFRKSLPPAVQYLLPSLDALALPADKYAGSMGTLTKPTGGPVVADKFHLTAVDVKRVKLLIEQGIKESEAVKTILNLKVKGGMQ